MVRRASISTTISPTLYISRLVFASADKVDSIWSKIASMSMIIVLPHQWLFNSHISIFGLRSSAQHFSLFDQGCNLHSRWNIWAAATPHLRIHSQCIWQGSCYRGMFFGMHRHVWRLTWKRIPCTIKVMKVLLRNHGLNLSGVKSDLYTLIGRSISTRNGVSWAHQILLKVWIANTPAEFHLLCALSLCHLVWIWKGDLNLGLEDYWHFIRQGN